MSPPPPPPPPGRAQAPRLVASGLAGIALPAIAVFTVRDFGVLVGSGPGSGLNWLLPGVIGAALVVGLVYGAVLRSTKPEVHARIQLGNEAFQLARAAEDAGPR